MRTTEFDREKIDAMLEHHGYAKAARAVNQDRGSFYRYIQRAVKEGFLFKKGKAWHKGPDYVTESEHRLMNEVHNLQIRYPVMNPNAEWQSQSQKVFQHYFYERHGGRIVRNEQMRLNHHYFEDMERFYVKTTTKNIFLVMKEDYPLMADDPDELQKMIDELAFKHKTILTNRFAVGLGDLEGVEFEIDSQHWVNRRLDLVAKAFVKSKVDLVICVDGERRTIVDKSKGRWDFENVHKKHAPLDGKAWNTLGEAVDKGDFKVYDVLNGMEEIKGIVANLAYQVTETNNTVGEVTKNQAVIAQNWNLHQAVLRGIEESNASIAQTIKQFGGRMVKRRRGKGEVPAGQHTLGGWLG